MNVAFDIGTWMTVACFVLSGAWFLFYTATGKWWTNRGGRLMVLMSFWQTTGFLILSSSSLSGDSMILDLVGHDLRGAIERLSFVTLVLGTLIYQWYSLLAERKEGRKHVEVPEGRSRNAGGNCDMGCDGWV